MHEFNSSLHATLLYLSIIKLQYLYLDLSVLVIASEINYFIYNPYLSLIQNLP